MKSLFLVAFTRLVNYARYHKPSATSVLRFLLSGLLLLALHLAHGQPTIGNWTFNNTLSGTHGLNNTVSAGSFSAGIPTTSFNGGTEYYGENGWPAGGINTSDYFQFSITPNAGMELDLTSIVLTIRRSNTGSPAGSGPNNWSLRSSLNGYSSDIGSGSMILTYSNYTVGLSGFATVPATVTFRLYGYNETTSSGGFSRFVLDNISIQGLSSVLPLQFTRFTAEEDAEEAIALHWSVADILAGTHFDVQRSLNGADFTSVNGSDEWVNRAMGEYNYTDKNLPAGIQKIFYRIQATEPSGHSYLSSVVAISRRTAVKLLIDKITIRGQSVFFQADVPEKGTYRISLGSVTGALLMSRTASLEAGAHTYSLPLGTIAHGSYFLSIYNNGAVSGRQFIF